MYFQAGLFTDISAIIFDTVVVGATVSDTLGTLRQLRELRAFHAKWLTRVLAGKG